MDGLLNFAQNQLKQQFSQQGQQGQQGQQQGQQQQNQSSFGQQQPGEQSFGGQQQQGGQSFGGQQQQSFGGQQQGNEQSFGGQQGGQSQSFGGQQQSNQQSFGGQQQQSQGFQPQQAGGFDLGSILSGMSQQHGNANELQSSGLLATALSAVQGVAKPTASIDEQKVQEDHDIAYKQGNASQLGASAMGSAAAIQAFKAFASQMGGSGGQQQGTQAAGGGSLISKLIGMALSEAAKLFDKSGGAKDGDKQDVLNSAGETMMKLMIQNQISGALGGGTSGATSSGGVGQLMSLASKFLK